MEDWSVSLFRLGFSLCGSDVDTEGISCILYTERERDYREESHWQNGIE